MKISYYCIAGVVAVVFSIPVSAQAARIFFEPAGGTYHVGDSATVHMKLDTQGESINAIDLHFLYPKILRIRSVSKSGSTIQLWVQDPSFTGSEIILSGGIPGGAQGVLTLARVNIEGAAVGEGRLGLGGGSAVLLNDGQGTPAQLSIAAADFQVTPRAPGASPVQGAPAKSPSTTPTTTQEPSPSPLDDNEAKDKEKPQRFSVLVGTDARVFAGRNFISFFTIDEQSGIDHYEIKEGKGVFRVARAPYLLSDQKLRSVIRVRAYDSAGNYRESVYPGVFGRVWLWIVNLFTRS